MRASSVTRRTLSSCWSYKCPNFLLIIKIEEYWKHCGIGANAPRNCPFIPIDVALDCFYFAEQETSVIRLQILLITWHCEVPRLTGKLLRVIGTFWRAWRERISLKRAQTVSRLSPHDNGLRLSWWWGGIFHNSWEEGPAAVLVCWIPPSVFPASPTLLLFVPRCSLVKRDNSVICILFHPPPPTTMVPCQGAKFIFSRAQRLIGSGTASEKQFVSKYRRKASPPSRSTQSHLFFARRLSFTTQELLQFGGDPISPA